MRRTENVTCTRTHGSKDVELPIKREKKPSLQAETLPSPNKSYAENLILLRFGCFTCHSVA